MREHDDTGYQFYLSCMLRAQSNFKYYLQILMNAGERTEKQYAISTMGFLSFLPNIKE